jgi:hypothetical protein
LCLSPEGGILIDENGMPLEAPLSANFPRIHTNKLNDSFEGISLEEGEYVAL